MPGFSRFFIVKINFITDLNGVHAAIQYFRDTFFITIETRGNISSESEYRLHAWTGRPQLRMAATSGEFL